MAVLAVLLILAQLSLFVSSQSPPACAVSCASQLAGQFGCGSFSNTVCVCSNLSFASQGATCVVDNCDPSVLQDATTFFLGLCDSGKHNNSSSYTRETFLSLYRFIDTVLQPRNQSHIEHFISGVGSAVLSRFLSRFHPCFFSGTEHTEHISHSQRSVTTHLNSRVTRLHVF
jgi:hypothetical protein